MASEWPCLGETMPKRSNDFQKLVFLLKKQLGEDMTVTESKMLRHLLTGDEREVDVCIETVVASHPVTVSIECRDHKRPADVKWVEEMKTKHQHLPTNALVLISRRGFSRKAISLAKALNIQMLTFDETTPETIDRVFGNLDSLWSKVFTLAPTKVVVRVGATGGLPAQNVPALPDNSVHNADGEVVAMIRDLLQDWLQSAKIMEELARKGTPSHKSFVVGWRWPKDKDGKTIYLQMLSPRLLRPVESIEVTGRYELEVSMFPLRHASLGGISVSWGKSKFTGRNAFLVASKDQSGTQRISIDVEPPEAHN